MSTLTPNLSLTKPAGSDAADIAVLNTDLDILDNAATLTGSQTLTNKTLTSPHMTTPVVDSGGLTITSGGLTVTAGTVTLPSGVTLTSPHFTSPVVDSGGLTVTAGGISSTTSDITGRRFKTVGSALVNGDFALSAGWGSTATVVANSNSEDGKFTFTVTAAGAGIAANPTVTLTFKDGTWTLVPMALCQLTGGTGAGGTPFGINVSPTATTLQFQPFFTPVSGSTYQFTALVMG